MAARFNYDNIEDINLNDLLVEFHFGIFFKFKILHLKREILIDKIILNISQFICN